MKIQKKIFLGGGGGGIGSGVGLWGQGGCERRSEVFNGSKLFIIISYYCSWMLGGLKKSSCTHL